MRIAQPISIILLALLATIITIATTDAEPVVSYAGDYFTYDGETVEVYRDGEVMDLTGRVVLLYQDGALQDTRFDDLNTLPMRLAVAWLMRGVGWQPTYMLGGYRIDGVTNPEQSEDVVIVFETNERKYTAPPPELQPTPTQERPSSSDQY